MVNTARVLEPNKGVEMAKYLSFPQVMSQLGVSRPTIYKWLAEGKLRAKKEEFGGRIQFKFSPEEIDRIGALLKPKREKGKSIVKEDE